MFAHTIMMLAAAASVALDPAGCRKVSSGRTGSAAWESDGKGHLSVSMDVPSAGEVTLECRVRVPSGTATVTVGFDQAHVSFQPSGSKSAGSGLVLQVGPSCRGELTRVAGEDWTEARKRAWSVPVSGRNVVVRVTAKDNSDKDPVRVDVEGLRVSFEPRADASECGH